MQNGHFIFVFLEVSYIHGTLIDAKMLFSYQKVTFEALLLRLNHHSLVKKDKFSVIKLSLSLKKVSSVAH